MPPQPPHGIFDTTLCVEELRDALAVHGITLPSLRPSGLVVLGSCTVPTARILAAALRGDRRASTPAALDVRVLAVPEVVADLRRSVRRYLGSPCDEVQLCVTELVANVVRHVGEGTPVRVRVACVACDRVRVEVTDPDARALPVLLRAAGDEEAGRGLALLDAVALRWGVEQRAQDKTVWCELPWPESGSGAEGLTRPASRRATT